MPATTVRCSSPTSTHSFNSFFDFGTCSAVRTFATRSSTFMNSSIDTRSPPAPCGACTSVPAERGSPVTSVPSGAAPRSPAGSLRGRGRRRQCRRQRRLRRRCIRFPVGRVAHGRLRSFGLGGRVGVAALGFEPRPEVGSLHERARRVRQPRGITREEQVTQRSRFSRPSEDLGARRRHDRQQQHGRDAHRLGHVEQHLRQRSACAGSRASAHGASRR